MEFNRKPDRMVPFGELKLGDTFILEHVADCAVDPIYRDCLCVKLMYHERPGVPAIYVSANLRYNRIDRIEDSKLVKQIDVEINEI